MESLDRNSEFDNFLKIHCCCYEKNIYPWQQENLHTPAWRFYWCSGEGGFLKINGEEIALSPQFFYIIPGYLVFSTLAKAPFEQFYIHFTPSDRLVLPKKISKIEADETSLQIIRNFINRDSAPENRQLTALTAMGILSCGLLRLPESVMRLPPEYDHRIERVLNFLQKQPLELYDNNRLAGIAKMSRNGFLRLFKEQVHETPQAYSRRKRIEKVCELLHYSDYTLDEIAMQTGFSDRYHLTKVFWKVMHFSPIGFRKLEKLQRSQK